MAACCRARALRAAIDEATDTTVWQKLRLELCTLLWLAQDAYERLHLAETHEDWFPLPTSSQGEGGGVAEEMDLTQQCTWSQADTTIDMTVLPPPPPPPALLPQERKLLVEQLQELLDGRAQKCPLNNDDGLQQLVDEYLR
ncbi:hypothetical protein JKP88DRAFT_250756 [Tribonema minus]|uniref:Uncharacterized protein n=1 Tax=Tribonema minus TaxID=303371 RepID=A0A835ZHU8_9STRA|nr:hypothetical protein JKP88DRAFT_250756 [Tribonema minus]